MKEINRREFLGGLSTGASGTLLGTMMPRHETVKNTKILRLSESEEKINPCDIKINVKPVFYSLIHSTRILKHNQYRLTKNIRVV